MVVGSEAAQLDEADVRIRLDGEQETALGEFAGKVRRMI
jgi:hypothetical protein